MLTLIDHLKQVEDFRDPKDIRHPLWLVLLLVIMGTMSGHLGNRAGRDFVKRHELEIISTFKLGPSRIPSYGTIRSVIMGVNYKQLIKSFNKWASQYINSNELEWVREKSLKKASLYIKNLGLVQRFGSRRRDFFCGHSKAADGKALRNTVTDYDKSSQNFANLVSFFSLKKELVIGLQKFDSKQGSYINIVRDLIKDLHLSNVVK